MKRTTNIYEDIIDDVKFPADKTDNVNEITVHKLSKIFAQICKHDGR